MTTVTERSGRYPWGDSENKYYPRSLFKMAARGDFSFMDDHNKAALFIGAFAKCGWFSPDELVDILKKDEKEWQLIIQQECMIFLAMDEKPINFGCVHVSNFALGKGTNAANNKNSYDLHALMDDGSIYWLEFTDEQIKDLYEQLGKWMKERDEQIKNMYEKLGKWMNEQ